MLEDYALAGPVASLEFRYKRRTHAVPLEEKSRAKLHSRVRRALWGGWGGADAAAAQAALKRFIEAVRKKEVQKVTELLDRVCAAPAAARVHVGQPAPAHRGRIPTSTRRTLGRPRSRLRWRWTAPSW